MSEPTYPEVNLEAELRQKDTEYQFAMEQWSSLVTARLMFLTDEQERMVGEIAELRHALAVAGLIEERDFADE